MIQLLKNKVAIVASNNEVVISSVAQLFLKQGASVMIVGTCADAFEDVLEAENSSHCLWLQADMTDLLEAQYCVSETVRRFGRADIFFYYPDAKDNRFFSEVNQTSQHTAITYAQDTWSQLVDTVPTLRNSDFSHIIVVDETPSDSELSYVGEVHSGNHRIRIDLINTQQRYQPKRQQKLTAYKQLTPERIARLSLSVLVKEKQEEVEWNEVLSWTSEYLDTSF